MIAEQSPDRASWTTVLHALVHWAAERPDAPAYAFLEGGAGTVERLTYGALHTRTQATAAAIREVTSPGDRVVLLFPQGLDFVAGFFGCLASGAIAVPTYPPRPKRPNDATAAVLADCEPRAVLTTAELAGAVERLAPGVRAVTPGGCAGSKDRLDPAEIDPQAVAMLQYTSGSTTEPRGVMVTHANLAHNQSLMYEALGRLPGPAVSWLPLYHDMGLIGHVLYPLWCGVTSYLMSSLDFLQRPLSWLEAISRLGGSIATAPNFAYDLCLRRTDPEQRAGLDLGGWSLALNGAEPVNGETVERFAEGFAAAGLDPHSIFPCYGLAEATLFVSGGPRGQGARLLSVDAAELERHVVAVCDSGDKRAQSLVASGSTWPEQRVEIVDPETAERCPDDRIGEIWISGPSVAAGYWNRPEDSARTFGARIAGSDATPYLRTGDLGFVRDGQLFVTGRLVDLIIAMGRNHYPQDIERTVDGCHVLLKPGRGAAFTARIDGRERLIVAHEVVTRGFRESDEQEVVERMRELVAEHHDLSLFDVVLLAPGGLPLTTSGKVKRRTCRRGYLDETLEEARERHR